jgi:hypothetical protein
METTQVIEEQRVSSKPANVRIPAKELNAEIKAQNKHNADEATRLLAAKAKMQAQKDMAKASEPKHPTVKVVTRAELKKAGKDLKSKAAPSKPVKSAKQSTPRRITFSQRCNEAVRDGGTWEQLIERLLKAAKETGCRKKVNASMIKTHYKWMLQSKSAKEYAKGRKITAKGIQ